MLKKSIDTSAPIHPLLAERYSGVSYDPTRTVPADLLTSIAEAGRWAPSCFGDEPWRMLICCKEQNPQAWEQALACLMEGNQPWCRQAPVLIIICTDTLFKHNDQPNPFGPYDTGAAALSMCLQATALGLMTHQMGGFVAARAQESFAIPERFKPLAMMTLGYQLPESDLPDAFKARELAPRKRHPLASQFFNGKWGKGM